MPVALEGLDHVALLVRDQAGSVAWYEHVLGLKRVFEAAFRVGRPAFDRARTELADRGVAARFEDHKVSHSLYFADPDGHRLELTTYEL
jgi:catechol 2,3-dioxygenase-like lactoylglutathione lyase family enzyme